MIKIKKIIIRVGNIIAILLMFSPIVILAYNTKIDKYWWILLIASICYSFYTFISIVEFDELMRKNKKIYENVRNGKAIESNTDEKKKNWYEIICTDIISEYFKYKK